MTHSPLIPAFDFSLIETRKPLALFLDIDGTLIEFATTPKGAIVPPELIPLLDRLYLELNGAIALITGRPIESADRLFPKKNLPIAGLHGGEYRINGTVNVVPAPPVPAELLTLAQELAEQWPGVFYEPKPFGFGLHYRKTPEAATPIANAFEPIIHKHPEFSLLKANMALELRPAGIDKGTAIDHFMEKQDFKNHHPIFFGDDVTDEDAFRTIRHRGGTAVVVGERRPPEAQFFIETPAQLRSLLANLSFDLKTA